MTGCHLRALTVIFPLDDPRPALYQPEKGRIPEEGRLRSMFFWLTGRKKPILLGNISTQHACGETLGSNFFSW
jgi:hypothetical protein